MHFWYVVSYDDFHEYLDIGIFYILFQICIMTLRSKGRKYYLGFFTCACVPNNWTGYICKTGQNKESLRSMLAKLRNFFVASLDFFSSTIHSLLTDTLFSIPSLPIVWYLILAKDFLLPLKVNFSMFRYVNISCQDACLSIIKV